MTTPTTSLSFWVYRRCTRSLSSAGRAASAKLWEDAAREEAEQASAPSNTVNLQVQQDKPWTGEESTSDAVLRMLVDKYKPLRSGRIQTAEEKLHSTQKASVSSAPIPATTPGSSDVKPWMVTFTPPKLTPSIKHANIPKSRGTSARSADQSGYDFQELKRLKRVKEIDRVTTARERTLDYRIGRGAAGSQGGNPLTLKGWANLVEDQIERAKAAGQFNNIKGRGKPLAVSTDESNPFIAREEYLLNRIVQRNEAAPPWVELQAELQSSISTFRRTLQDAWVRRAVRMIGSGEHGTRELSERALNGFRDREWEGRERSFHELSIKELNNLIRKYNNAAPYAVRKAYLELSSELEQMYAGSGGEIIAELEARRKAGVKPTPASEEKRSPKREGETSGLFRQIVEALKRMVSSSHDGKP